MIKCKWVTHNILAAKLYGIAHRFDIGAVTKVTLRRIIKSAVPLILCTNSKFLYNCLVKLGIMKEKQLIIDMISLHQLYKQQKITEVKWIHRHHNLTDLMTKAKCLSGLKTLININGINISTIKWIERESMKQASTKI